MINRKTTSPIKVGSNIVGGYHPILVQSMVNVDSHDTAAVVKQIHQLEEVGCDIVRVGFLDLASVQNISAIKKRIHIPLVADIHFNHQFALEAINQGTDKIRLNPGNIGGAEPVKKVVAAAAKARIPIRLGVNTGSIQPDILRRYGHPTAQALVDSALDNVKLLESFDFDQIIISVKSSSVSMTVEAYQLLSSQVNYPLHLGVTEAGLKDDSTVKSSIGIGSLLLQGIGDTIRVSLTGDPVDEVVIGRNILKSLDLQSGPTLIACPTCSRTNFDMLPLAAQVSTYLDSLPRYKNITVAVMGCAVNGPGEAREADVGVAGGKDSGVLFKKGKVVKTVSTEQLYPELIKLLNEI
ncbi:flavodoxin-dependent (E)-4-hydroxy-3-methylbut-2-enyl-diphosphate synthase [Microgenomates group bacterium]|nr:flavodoxin-dependent (E)-4-hydroxy-3-methylbut-2-enyl-diphosphate synthase [Microgenomates group bacterium]